MRIRWLEETIYDLQALRQYIEQENPLAANHIAKRIVKAVESLVLHPEIGRAGRVPNTRELVISGTPYIVPYQVTEQGLEILRILHGAMQWSQTFTKSKQAEPALPT